MPQSEKTANEKKKLMKREEKKAFKQKIEYNKIEPIFREKPPG
jgi:hypothetical protein